MRRPLLVTLAALCVSACASAPPATTPAAAEPAALTAEPTTAAEPAATGTAASGEAQEGTQVASAETKPKLICYEEPATGTHIRRPVRVCATAEEWARRREESQRALGNLGRRGGQTAVQGR